MTPTRLATLGLIFMSQLMSGCSSREAPVQEKLTDCTNSILQFKMSVHHNPPYQFLLGLSSPTLASNFHGEIVVSESARTVARIRIDPQHVMPCNWLKGCVGYIVTRAPRDGQGQLRTLLKKGQSYDVEVHFSEQPPPLSSLWLASMEEIRR